VATARGVSLDVRRRDDEAIPLATPGLLYARPTMDLAQIRHVAELAELKLSPDEEQKMAAEVGRIVAYVAELDAIDTSDVPPTAHVGHDLSGARSGEHWRADELVPCLSHEDALAAAPRAEHEGFAVPGFVE
jgi:aspartyl-tRNA(Asn)/glutamyl-tRNA(Gln) amidotransferase subunit C